jgi:hypothetical protein
MRIGLTIAVAASFVAAPAATAQAPATASSQAREPKICETITITGSRLGARRICATQAEWNERRRSDREEVEKAQRSPCVIQTTGSGGRPSC